MTHDTTLYPSRHIRSVFSLFRCPESSANSDTFELNLRRFLEEFSELCPPIRCDSIRGFLKKPSAESIRIFASFRDDSLPGYFHFRFHAQFLCTYLVNWKDKASIQFTMYNEFEYYILLYLPSQYYDVNIFETAISDTYSTLILPSVQSSIFTTNYSLILFSYVF
jgi:hypothetical protein